MQKSFQRVNIPKLPVLTTEQGILNIKKQINELKDWTDIKDLIPENLKTDLNKKKTGLSGIFAASLELTKEGMIKIFQEKIFEKIMIKKTND